ncbi:uncharacterized protein LOC100178715 [Ciona intestinalis]
MAGTSDIGKNQPISPHSDDKITTQPKRDIASNIIEVQKCKNNNASEGDAKVLVNLCDATDSKVVSLTTKLQNVMQRLDKLEDNQKNFQQDVMGKFEDVTSALKRIFQKLDAQNPQQLKKAIMEVMADQSTQTSLSLDTACCQSVVVIHDKTADAGVGTGFVIDPNDKVLETQLDFPPDMICIMTANHVLQGVTQAQIKWTSSSKFNADKVIGCKEHDIATIWIKNPFKGGTGCRPLPFCASIKTAATVYFVGTSADDLPNRVVTGNMSRTERIVKGRPLTECSGLLEPGYSGSPALSVEGEVVGIVTTGTYDKNTVYLISRSSIMKYFRSKKEDIETYLKTQKCKKTQF